MASSAGRTEDASLSTSSSSPGGDGIAKPHCEPRCDSSPKLEEEEESDKIEAVEGSEATEPSPPPSLGEQQREDDEGSEEEPSSDDGDATSLPCDDAGELGEADAVLESESIVVLVQDHLESDDDEEEEEGGDGIAIGRVLWSREQVASDEKTPVVLPGRPVARKRVETLYSFSYSDRVVEMRLREKELGLSLPEVDASPPLPSMREFQDGLCDDVWWQILSFLPPRDLFLFPHAGPNRPLRQRAFSDHLWKPHLRDLREFFANLRKTYIEGREVGSQIHSLQEVMGWERPIKHYAPGARTNWEMCKNLRKRHNGKIPSYPSFEAVGAPVENDDEASGVGDAVSARLKWAVLKYAPIRLRDCLFMLQGRRMKDPNLFKVMETNKISNCRIFHALFIAIFPILAMLCIIAAIAVLMVSNILSMTAVSSVQTLTNALYVTTLVFAVAGFALCATSIGCLLCGDEVVSNLRTRSQARRLDALKRLVSHDLLGAIPFGVQDSLRHAITLVRPSSSPFVSWSPLFAFPFSACLAIPSALITICLAHWIAAYALFFMLSVVFVAVLLLVCLGVSHNLCPSLRRDNGAWSLRRTFVPALVFIVVPWWLVSSVVLLVGVLRDAKSTAEDSDSVDMIGGVVCTIGAVLGCGWLCVGFSLYVSASNGIGRCVERCGEASSCLAVLVVSLANPVLYACFLIPAAVYFFAGRERWIAGILTLPLPCVGIGGVIYLFYYVSSDESRTFYEDL